MSDQHLPYSSALLIRVESSAGPLPADLFLRVARDVVSTAEEIGRTLTQRETTWNLIGVEFQPGEPTAAAIRIEPGPVHAEVSKVLREGIRAIHAQTEERPPGFSDAALRLLRRISSGATRRYRISLSAGTGSGEAIFLDDLIATHIDTWLRGQTESFGSVEGKLEIISIHTRPRFTIYWRGGIRIECLFPESMLPEVAAALGQRVCIRGRISYRRDGQPALVEAHYLKRLPIPDGTHSVEAMIGLQDQAVAESRSIQNRGSGKAESQQQALL